MGRVMGSDPSNTFIFNNLTPENGLEKVLLARF